MPRPIECQFSFADFELRKQGFPAEPEIRVIGETLERFPDLVRLVAKDLDRNLKNRRTGRNGLNADQVLRALVLRRIKDWDYRELQIRIADSVSLRQFAKFDSRPVPKHDAFARAINRIRPDTMRKLNEALVVVMVKMKITDGSKLRMDSTVVETDVHYPTDANLLWDGVRVLTRLASRITKLVPATAQLFRNRTKRARRRLFEINAMTPKTRPRNLRRKYADLCRTTEDVLGMARQIVQVCRKTPSCSQDNLLTIEGSCGEIEKVGRLTERAIDQARRRVLQGEVVPAAEKILSLFEPHTELIVRGKVRTPVEFGRKVFLAETKPGIVTDYQILLGNPADVLHLPDALERVENLLGHAPDICAADRGFYSQANLDECADRHVRLAAIPQRGGHKTPERAAIESSKEFKAAQRFRAGIEGRISVMVRGRGMKRCRSEGPERFEVFVGACVLANNLLVLAALLLAPSRRAKRKPQPRR